MNTKKTKIEISQQHSVSESINIEHTDLKSGSVAKETEHLESEGLGQTGDENWEHQLKLKDDKMSCLLETWQTKEHELNKKIQELEINLKRKEAPGRDTSPFVTSDCALPSFSVPLRNDNHSFSLSLVRFRE